MTPNGSLFFDEWQACLRAHYVHVIRTHDTITEPTLRSVLLATGLSEDELEALRQEAVADAAIVDEAVDSLSETTPAPVETLLPDEDALPHDVAPGDTALEDEVEPLTPADLGTDLAPVPPDAPDAELPPDAFDEDATTTDDPEPYSPAPGQLSLF